MRTRSFGLVALMGMAISGLAAAANPSVYIMSRGDGPVASADKAASEVWMTSVNSHIGSAVLRRIPCGDIMSEEGARAIVGFERERQLLSAGDDKLLANLGGAIGASTVILATTTVSGGQVQVTISAFDSKTARMTSRASRSFPVEESGEPTKQFANEFVQSIPGLRCPAWTGTVLVKFSGSGTDPGGASVSGNTTVDCTLDGQQDEMATCQVSVQGSSKDRDGGSMTTQGSEKVRTTIAVGGDSQVTTIKVGTFKMKVHTNVTLVFKQDDGKSTSMSTAADEVREDGGWEFTGLGGTGKQRTGSWTSPDGFFTAQWDLTYK